MWYNVDGERWSLFPCEGRWTLMEIISILSLILDVIAIVIAAFTIGYTVGSNQKK